MANNIKYTTLFQQALDLQMIQQSTTGWMEANAGDVIYNGGAEIKIPKIAMDGLGNYDRQNGYAPGSVDLTYETMTMTQDRSRTFTLDAMDVNESNFVANASNVMAQFQKLKVIPEVDAYRYSKIASLAITKGTGYASGGYAPNATDILARLKADIATIQDRTGASNLIISMNYNTKNILENSSEVSKHIEVTNFINGSFSTKVSSIDEFPIMPVPNVRFKTAYTFYDGKTAGQESGGFVTNANSKNINWIISAVTAPKAVSKTDNMRIFDPQTNQSANAYKLDYRKYHDLWILDNAMDNIFVNVKEALS